MESSDIMNLDDILGIKDVNQGGISGGEDTMNIKSPDFRNKPYHAHPLNNKEPNTPFNEVSSSSDEKEIMPPSYDSDNPLGIPMSRSQIAEQREKEKEQPEEETRNSSGYFGGPIGPKTESEFLMKNSQIDNSEE